MALYTVEAPDGRMLEIEGPDGASEQTVLAAARKLYLEQANKPQEAPAPDTAKGGFGAAFSAGLEGVKAAGAAVAGKVGILNEDTAQQYIEEKQRRQQEIFRPTEEGWTGAPFTKFAETLGGSLPYIAAPVVGALAAKPILAGTAAAGIAGTIGGIAAGTAQFTGTNLLRQMDEGKKLSETDLAAAGITAPAQAALDVVGLRFVPGIRKIFADAGKEISEAAAKKIAERGILSNVILTGGKAATAEGFTETGQQLLERMQAGLDIADEKARDEYLESFISGSVLGGTFGGVAGVGARGRARGVVQEKEAERTRLAAEEQARLEQEQVAPPGIEAPAAPVAPTEPAPTAADFLTPEEARIQKQQAAIEQFGLETDFPAEMARTEGVGREERQRQVQAQLDAQAGQPGAPAEGQQGDLFADALRRARIEGAPLDVQRQLLEASAAAQPADTTIAPTPQAAQEIAPIEGAVPPGQMALPLVGGRTPQQIKIENYVAQENEIALMGAREAQAQREAQGAEAVKLQEMERLQFESDLAEIDGQVRNTKRRTMEQNRLGLLLPLIENPAVTNIPKAFGRALQQSGITDIEFTARERNLIQRAYDVRNAAAPTPAAPEIIPASPDEAPADLVKERKTTVEPQQPSFPGFGKSSVKGKPVDTTVAIPEAPTPALPAAPITEQSLDTLKLPKASTLRKWLLGKDMSDPQQQQEVNTKLRAALGNPKLPNATKKAIRDVLQQSEFTRQGEMFGPLGGILKPLPAPAQQEAQRDRNVLPGADTAATQQGAVGRADQRGMGVDTMGGRPAQAPTGAPTPVQGAGLGGLADTDTGTKPDTARAETSPSAVAGVTQRKAKDAVGNSVTEVTLPDGSTHQLIRLNATESMGLPGWHDASKSGATEFGFLGNTKDEAIKELLSRAKSRPAAQQTAPQAPAPTAPSVFNMMVQQISQPEAPKTTTKGKIYRPLDERGKKKKEAPSKLEKETADQVTNVVAAPLYVPLPVQVRALLRGNKLVDALRVYAETAPGEVGRIALALANVLKNTKVRVLQPADFQRMILERSGEGYGDATGVFYSSTNEIYLDENAGFDGHTLLHEATHAAADQVIDNPAHPLTKKLQAIYDTLGKQIKGTYGATNLKEFAAEAFGNPKFRELLDTITPQGEKVTLLTKFVRAIRDFARNVMRLPAVKDETALNEVDRIMSAIVAPGVLGTSPVISAQQASFLRQGDQKLNAVTRAINAAPLGSEKLKDSVDNFLTSTAPGGAKTLLRAMLPLNALVDVAKKYLPSAPKMDDLVNEKSGYQNKLMHDIEPIIQEASKFAKKASLEQMQGFNKVVYKSTLAQVDPSKPRDAYKGDTEKLKVWDELAPLWKGMAATGGQQMYTRIRDTYAKLYDEIGRVIGTRIDDTDVDAETKRTVKTQLLAKIMEATGNIEPYFPLLRRGDFWLSYTITDPTTGQPEPVIEAYETERARNRAIQALQGSKEVVADSIETFAKIQDMSFRNAPTGSFINSVLRTLDAGGIDQDTKDQVMQLFINSLPESAIVQSFRRRQGVLGFEQDALRALKERSYSMARQLANIKYGAKLSNVDAQLREEARTNRGQEAKELYEELHKRVDFAINPNIPKWGQVATSLTFASTLGFNLSSALVNLSQIPLVVLPYLGGKYGFGATARAIGNATRMFANSGTTQQRKTILGDTVQMRVAQSLDNYNFDDPNTPPQIMKYKELAEVSSQYGQLNRSQTYDMLDVGNEDTLITKVNAVSGYLFHYGERMNRQISLMAAYDLELADMKKKGRTIDEAARREAAKTAIELSELTNGGVASAAAPRIAQNALGKVLFMYKRYGVSMYYMMFKTARESLKSADPEVRKAAKRQIAGIYASAALISGVQGVPMYGVAAFVYDMFKEDDEDDFRSATRKMLGEGWYKGMINDFTGMDVASRVGLSDLLFRDSTISKDTDPMLALMQTMGGPVFGVAQKMVRGVNDVQEGNVMRGIEQILPSAFGNMLKAYRFGTEGALTRRGDPIMQEFTPQSVVAQALGFSSADYTKVQETVGKEKEKERSRLDARAKLTTKYYVALREGDYAEVQDIIEKMKEYNAKNPKLAITAEYLRRSMSDRARVSSEMIGGVSFNKRLLGEVRESLAEYNGE